MKNLRKLQTLQTEIRMSNRKQVDDGECEDDQDELYEEYFTKQMEMDMEIVNERSEPVDYGKILSNIHSQIENINYEEEENKCDDDEADHYL